MISTGAAGTAVAVGGNDVGVAVGTAVGNSGSLAGVFVTGNSALVDVGIASATAMVGEAAGTTGGVTDGSSDPQAAIIKQNISRKICLFFMGLMIRRI